MLVAPLLAPRRDAQLFDLAAAPGGKACHLAELLDGTGCVHAFDRSPKRLARVRDNAARLGLDNIDVAEADVGRLDLQPADGVLLDAPCTGLGVLARRPDLRWRKRPQDLLRLQALQLELLETAAALTAPGAPLVYCVCSFEPEETMEVAARFSTLHPEMLPDDAGMPETLHAGPGLRYFLPQAHGLDGGFVARWRKSR
jgi:16S rRNA (cytosine967-C5)-methyltransferase